MATPHSRTPLSRREIAALIAASLVQFDVNGPGPCIARTQGPGRCSWRLGRDGVGFVAPAPVSFGHSGASAVRELPTLLSAFFRRVPVLAGVQS